MKYRSKKRVSIIIYLILKTAKYGKNSTQSSIIIWKLQTLLHHWKIRAFLT